MVTDTVLLTLLAIAGAVLLDLAVMRRLRAALRRGSPGAQAGGPEVRVLGRVSPLLTWLRYRRLPAPAQGAPSARAGETQEAANVAAGIPGAGALNGALRRLRAGGLTLDRALFGSGLALYLATRLIGLADFPIYFFTDEAAHTVLAENFVREGLTNLQGEFLPTYFPLTNMFGLNGVSVYLQVAPYLLFGKSVYVTRAVSALVTVIAAAAVGLILRDFFKARYWWAGTLLLAIAPTWFLHSRTAFENIEVASFYAGFLYFYLRYRHGRPRSLYAAVVMGALTFYTHGLGQVLMGVTGLALLLLDLRYHLDPARRGVLRRAGLLLLLVALPFARFWLAHPAVLAEQLSMRGSTVTAVGLPFLERARQVAAEYLFGLSPVFWFAAFNKRDEIRHIMAGYGNLLPITLPFLLAGLLLALRRWREPAARVTLAALLASPAGAALVAIGAPRVLWMVVPMTILTGLGLSACLEWLERRGAPRAALALGTAALLSGISLYMLRDALVNGPTWFSVYGLYGMQYGARQVFGEAVPEYLQADPETVLAISPNWTNGPEVLAIFFLTEAERRRVELQSIDYYLTGLRDLDSNLIVALPAPEYERARDDPRFAKVAVDRILPYPNGEPGFYFVRLEYAPEAEALIAAADAALRRPTRSRVVIDGQTVDVEHTQMNGGRIEDVFDGNWETLARTADVNPAALDLRFPAPRMVTGVTISLGSMDADLRAELYRVEAAPAEPLVFRQSYTGLPADPTVDLSFGPEPVLVTRLRLEILNRGEGERGPVHIREVTLR